MRVFIYGHTHERELPWPVRATDLRRVTVLNACAFQRVVDKAGFLTRAALVPFAVSSPIRNQAGAR